MNVIKCVFVSNDEITSFQWNLTIRAAITVTKTQAAAQIAAWMKLTLKRTAQSYGHLGVMQVNSRFFTVVFYFSMRMRVSMWGSLIYYYWPYDDEKKGRQRNKKKTHCTFLVFFHFLPLLHRITTHYSINIISHCMVIGHKMWKTIYMQNYLFAAKKCMHMQSNLSMAFHRVLQFIVLK